MGSYKDPNHGSDDVVENLVQRLRLYKPTPVSDETQFSVKRAAVLVCIFQGNNGDLRVILTKRSSSLSSHSGKYIYRLNFVISPCAMYKL